MARRVGALAGAELAGNEVSAFGGDVQEARLARRLIVGDGGLVEMPEVVELMAHFEIRPTLLPHPVNGRGAADSPDRVQVSVRFLGPRDPVDDPVHDFIEPGVGTGRHGVGSRLDRLVDIGVVEGEVGAEPQPRCPGQRLLGHVEVPDAVGLLVLLDDVGDRHGPVRFEARRPERVVEMDVRERHGLHRIIGFRGLLGAGRGKNEGDGQRRDHEQNSSLHRGPP